MRHGSSHGDVCVPDKHGAGSCLSDIVSSLCRLLHGNVCRCSRKKPG